MERSHKEDGIKKFNVMYRSFIRYVYTTFIVDPLFMNKYDEYISVNKEEYMYDRVKTFYYDNMEKILDPKNLYTPDFLITFPHLEQVRDIIIRKWSYLMTPIAKSQISSHFSECMIVFGGCHQFGDLFTNKKINSKINNADTPLSSFKKATEIITSMSGEGQDNIKSKKEHIDIKFLTKMYMIYDKNGDIESYVKTLCK